MGRPPAAFVGRDDALGVLRTAVRRASGGHPSVLIVTGETGVGKTRLVRELMAGSFEAGDNLLSLYREGGAERSHDVLAVLRQQVLIRTNAPTLIEQLRDAAIADRNPVYAGAIEHVLAT